jgi:ATP-dependent RNA helicase RhlE
MVRFRELPISPYLQGRLAAAEFVTPTEVQAATIPHAICGKDILATAQTGTGKTLAFLAPIIEKLLTEKLSAKDAKDKAAGGRVSPLRPAQAVTGVRAIVLVPTRELAMQINQQYEQLRGKKLPPAALLIGGSSERPQVQALRGGAQLVVATPGRFEDLLDRKLFKLDAVNTLVLDEADRMLDMGFIPAIRRIVAKLPRSRQTMCFSATLEPSVAHLVDDYLRDPVRLAFGSTRAASESVALTAYQVEADQKLSLLRRLLERENGRSLVFVRTKRATQRLADKLERSGMSVAVIHGDRTQSQRTHALASFQQGKSRVLVATDVASRGIHVDDIAQVINYDLPAIAEDFIHRVGRTGRAGATGAAATFFTTVERADLARLERSLQLKIKRARVDGELAREERPGPVDISAMIPSPVKPGSKMMRLPGEVLQRHA